MKDRETTEGARSLLAQMWHIRKNELTCRRVIMYKVLFTILTIGILLSGICFVCSANQLGINVSEDSVGALGDYKTVIRSWEFEADAQAQKSETLSLGANLSAQYNVKTVGLKPFISYNRDDIGKIVDAGVVVNWSIGSVDIAGGASFRGANPTSAGLEDRYDGDDNLVQVKSSGYSPNSYRLPEVNNINAVFSTGFEKWKVETDLTAYAPITKRDIVPVIVISRSQTSIQLWGNLSASLVMDARTYIHTDGIEIEFSPQGGLTFRF